MILKKYYKDKLAVIFSIKDNYDHTEVYYLEDTEFTGELMMYYDTETENLYNHGYFNRGYKVKEWKYYYPNGNLEFTESYVNGVKNGKFEKYYENGAIKSRTFFLDNKENPF